MDSPSRPRQHDEPSRAYHPSRSAPASRLPSPPPSLPPRPRSPGYYPPAGRGVTSAADSPRGHRERSPRGPRWEDDRRHPRDRDRDRDGGLGGLGRDQQRDRDYGRGPGRDREYGREQGRDRARDPADFRRRDAPPHVLPPFRGTLGDERSRSSTPRFPGSPYGGPDLKARREERERAEFCIWPASPERPYAEVLAREERDKERDRERDRERKAGSKRRSRRRRHESDESDDERERERRRRRRREKERRRERGASADGERRRDRGEDDEWAERRSRSRSRSRSPRRSKSKSRRSSSRSRTRTRTRSVSRGLELSSAAPAPAWAVEAGTGDEDGAEEVGPQPPSELQIAGRFEREVGRNLLPGEAEAMRQYVEAGQRIPRRGEIGLDQNKIMQYEASGFVMSGSRNARMNAVRVRKETQVVNAQDKIDLIMARKEEADRKEGEIISQFKEIVEERLREEERRRRDRA